MLWRRDVSATVTTCGSDGTASPRRPSLDRARNRLYVIGADGLLNALDLSTGATAAGWPLRIVQFTGAEYAWGGLSLVGTRVYVPIASYCDKSDADGYLADGRLVAVDVVDVGIAATFEVVGGPNNMGGIWGYAGTSYDPETGHLTATGNSWVYDPECGASSRPSATARASSSSTVISTSSTGAVRRASRSSKTTTSVQRPYSSSRRAVRRSPRRTRRTAASTCGFVTIRRGALLERPRGAYELGGAFIAQPSYSRDLNMLFISDGRDYDDEGAVRTFDAVIAFAIGPGCSLPEKPTWTAPDIGRGPKTPPLVVDDLVFVPGGFDHNVFALDARTGKTLWSVGLPGAVLAPIAFTRDKVLVADATGTLHALAS